MKIILNRVRAESKSFVLNKPLLLFIEASRGMGSGDLETAVTLRCKTDNSRKLTIEPCGVPLRISAGNDRTTVAASVIVRGGPESLFVVIDAVVEDEGTEHTQSCVLRVEGAS